MPENVLLKTLSVWFQEQSIPVTEPTSFLSEFNNVFFEKIGVTQDNQFEINNIGKIPVKELIRTHELWFQKFTNWIFIK